MKVAIPVWSGRVSPVFDVAGRLLLAAVRDGELVSREEIALEADTWGDRARRLADLGVDALICGAVSAEMEALLRGAGITVIPHICGRAEEVLRSFLEGRIDQGRFRMPGCCGRRQRGRARRRRRGGPWTDERTFT